MAGVPTPAITSLRNPLLKEVRKAAQHGGLTAGGCLVAEGPHLLEEALSSGCAVQTIIASRPLPATLEQQRQRLGVPLIAVSPALFDSLGTTENSQGLIALVEPPRWSWPELLAGLPLVVILDRLQDPGNAGAILRSAEAFGATGVVFLKGSVSPYNPKAVRASAGSIFRLPLLSAVDPSECLTALRQSGLRLYAADPVRGPSLSEASWSGGCALIIGSEAHGVSPALASAAEPVRIPVSRVESLNAAVAAAVLLYEARRQRGCSP
jgi:TrmH family RNA methyltransferase